ncbi:MAG TPA: orotate phosphoribosyltransferase [Candidatus Saccharicenans sp.]|mgnify:FL=1|jgi:orotate phosphoribosyltransferase|nr:orotate phosphoribosyltransferase [Candidatus Saccharicenans sp.]HRD01573.1 orotate phosphoribosyltransferase [Candidatus Saccharicenans sp.]
MPQDRSELILSLFQESNALLRGHFKLTSGKHSEWYFEKIKLIERPLVLEKIIDLLVEQIRQDNLAFDYVISPAYGGIAIGFLAALKLNKLFAFSQRADEKMTIRSGFSGLDKSRAIIVEDIVTTGGSIREVLHCLHQKEVEVAEIYCLVDRSGGEVLFEGQPARSLLSLKVEAFEPEACPLCQQNLPLIKPGASDKK